MKRAPIFTSLALASLFAFGALTLRASDHRDGDRVAADPTMDITDVFAFMRPVHDDAGGYEPSNHLVLALTVHPDAPADARFDPSGEYKLNVFGAKADAGGVDPSLQLTMDCRFQPAAASGHQPFVCSMNGFFFAGETDVMSGNANDPIRVFAGRRADPAFGAAKAIAASVDAGMLLEAGSNDFASSNVLAIVAELDVDRVVFADAGRRPLIVGGATRRGP